MSRSDRREPGIVGIRLHGLAVHLDGVFRLVPRLVDVPEGRPGAVVVGIELDGLGQTGDGLVPVFGLDGEAAEEELGLGQLRLTFGQAEQDGARPFVRLLLDVVTSQRQVRLLGRRVQRDDSFELGLGLAIPLLGAQELGQRQMGAGVFGRELHGLSGSGQRGLGLIGTGQPLGHLAPQEGRLGVALDGLLHGRDCLAEAAVLRHHLCGRIMIVGVAGLRRGDEARPPWRLITVDGSDGPLRGATGGERRQRDHDEASSRGGEEATRRIAKRFVADGGDGGVDVALLFRRQSAAPSLGARRNGRGVLCHRCQHEAQGGDRGELRPKSRRQVRRAQRQLVQPG